MKLSDKEIERRRALSIKAHKEMQEDELVIQFYKENGPCCSGCDHWRYFNNVIGECQKSNLMGMSDRLSILGITHWTGPREAGKALTERGYYCESFIDSDLQKK